MCLLHAFSSTWMLGMYEVCPDACHFFVTSLIINTAASCRIPTWRRRKLRPRLVEWLCKATKLACGKAQAWAWISRLWDSPGKNTGVGCHFLLQCMKWKVKVKSVSGFVLLATPWTAAYQAPPPIYIYNIYIYIFNPYNLPMSSYYYCILKMNKLRYEAVK